MALGTGKRMVVVAVVAALVAAGLGYWAYHTYRLGVLRSGVAALLTKASAQMRDALAAEAGAAQADRLKLAKKLDDHAAAIDALVVQLKLKRLELERDTRLTDAADEYLLTCREMLRRRAASQRAYALLTDSMEALRDQMRAAATDRSAKWPRETVRARERAERDFRDYRNASAAYATLLGQFPTSQKKIAPYVEPPALIDDKLVGAARERSLATAKQIAGEMEKLRQLHTNR
jgi:hypothetical protein